jgi:hypothetical protein
MNRGVKASSPLPSPPEEEEREKTPSASVVRGFKARKSFRGILSPTHSSLAGGVEGDGV